MDDRISAPGPYLKTKSFGCALVRTGPLIRPGHTLEKKDKISKKCQVSKYCVKDAKFLPKYFPKLITIILFSPLFQLTPAPSFKWVGPGRF